MTSPQNKPSVRPDGHLGHLGRRLVVPVVITGTVGLALLLSGCAGGSSGPITTGAATAHGDPTAPASSSPTLKPTGEPVATTSADVFTLGLGDCLIDSPDQHVSDVPTVPCGQAHDLEVFGDFTLPDSATYPGTDAVQTAGDAGCKEQFAPFVGLDYATSVLAFTEYVPTENSWASGDRTVTCVVGDPSGKTTGSLRGVAR